MLLLLLTQVGLLAIVAEFGLSEAGGAPATTTAAGAAVLDAATESSADTDAVQAYYVEQAALDFVGRKALLARLQEFADSDVQGYVPGAMHPGASRP